MRIMFPQSRPRVPMVLIQIVNVGIYEQDVWNQPPSNSTQVYYNTAQYHLLYTSTTISLQMFISRTATRCTKSVVRNQAQWQQYESSSSNNKQQQTRHLSTNETSIFVQLESRIDKQRLRTAKLCYNALLRLTWHS